MKTLTPKQIEKLTPFELKYYIERGILSVMENKPIPQRPARIEDTQEFKKHKDLTGMPISLLAACRKYEIATSTMSRWVHRGLIKKMTPDKNRVVLDEAYVAYAVEVFKANKKTKGKWLFDTNGTPYIKTTR